jgi:hypothetical protein
MGGASAILMQDVLLPSLIPLLDDPATAAGAFPIAAQLVAAAVTAPGSSSNGPAAMEVDGGAAAAANGNGVAGHTGAADVLLSKMAGVLDDRWAVEATCVMHKQSPRLGQPLEYLSFANLGHAHTSAAKVQHTRWLLTAQS